MLNFWQQGLSKAYKNHVQHEIEFSRKKCQSLDVAKEKV